MINVEACRPPTVRQVREVTSIACFDRRATRSATSCLTACSRRQVESIVRPAARSTNSRPKTGTFTWYLFLYSTKCCTCVKHSIRQACGAHAWLSVALRGMVSCGLGDGFCCHAGIIVCVRLYSPRHGERVAFLRRWPARAKSRPIYGKHVARGLCRHVKRGVYFGCLAVAACRRRRAARIF